jgi:hypothetical protein
MLPMDIEIGLLVPAMPFITLLIKLLISSNGGRNERSFRSCPGSSQSGLPAGSEPSLLNI